MPWKPWWCSCSVLQIRSPSTCSWRHRWLQITRFWLEKSWPSTHKITTRLTPKSGWDMMHTASTCRLSESIWNNDDGTSFCCLSSYTQISWTTVWLMWFFMYNQMWSTSTSLCPSVEPMASCSSKLTNRCTHHFRVVSQVCPSSGLNLLLNRTLDSGSQTQPYISPWKAQLYNGLFSGGPCLLVKLRICGYRLQYVAQVIWLIWLL